MALSTGKILVTLFDEVMEQLNKNDVYTRNTRVDSIEPDRMQNASNVYWKTVEQQAPVIEGWDLTGQETGIIEQYYPLTLSTPKNDFIQLRVDDLRDKGFMERRTRASAKRLSAKLNSDIANLVADTGSLYYESSSTGYNFISEANTILKERQAETSMGQSFYMPPRDAQVMSNDLASRDSSLSDINKEAYQSWHSNNQTKKCQKRRMAYKK